MSPSVSRIVPVCTFLACAVPLAVSAPQASAATKHCPKYGRAYDITAKGVTCKTTRIVYREARRFGDAISVGYRCDVAAPRGTRHLRYTCRNGRRSVAFSIRGGKSF